MLGRIMPLVLAIALVVAGRGYRGAWDDSMLVRPNGLGQQTQAQNTAR